MKLLFHLIIISSTWIIASCTSLPTSNPWDHPYRDFTVSLGPENERFLASLHLCMEYANDTFPDALRRYEADLEGSMALTVKVLDDDKMISWIGVDNTEGNLINGRIIGRHIIKGRFYADGDKITLNKSDTVDWIISYRDRPPEGNMLGKYILLKMDGLVPGDCDPSNLEFQQYRYFSMSYSFIPPGTEGWEMRGPSEETDMSMQEKGSSLDELNTLFSARYSMPAIDSIQELINETKAHMELAPGGDSRYTALSHEVKSYPKNEALCALSQQVVEDKKALLLSGKRGPMIREVQTLMCLHPYEKNVGVKLNYSHRYHPENRDEEFINKANRVFESLAFTKK